jgi:hypothetical protein
VNKFMLLAGIGWMKYYKGPQAGNERPLRAMIRGILLVLLLVSLLAVPFRTPQASGEAWQFAVSGDSRNCGDVVMPAIARSVLAHQVEFYWHLGDFRLGSGIDEDMQNQSGGKLTTEEYHKKAWDDFIAQQINPFGSLTVHLGIGNHELYMHGTTKEDENLSHAEFITKFSKWLGGSKAAYYRWKVRHVDFINLDNSRSDGFDKNQLAWLETVLNEDRSDGDVHAVVVGMHRALPNSLACGHSMNGDPYSSAESNRKSTDSGREAYQYLWDFQNTTRKGVYVLASHSHLYVENIFNTSYWNRKNEKEEAVLKNKNEKEETTLKGWLIGTAGAIRYRLPDNLPPDTLAITYAYGYLLGTVYPDGKITFEFQQVAENDVPPQVVTRYGKHFVDICFLANRDDGSRSLPESCKEE